MPLPPELPADLPPPAPPVLPPWRPQSTKRPSRLAQLGPAVAAGVKRVFRGKPVDEETSIDRLAGSAPPWLASVIIHSIFLLLCGLVAVQVHHDRTSEMDIELAAPVDDLENEIWAETVGQQLDTPTPGVNEQELLDGMKTGYSLSDLPPVDDPLAAPRPTLGPPSADGLEVLSSIEAPSIGLALKGRETGYKEALLLAYGGTKSTKESVALALAWLARHQDKDGSWSLRGKYSDGATAENRPAATAMALLAFLGDGRTHISDDPFRRNIHRGLNYLLKIQEDDGRFASEGIPQNHRLYTQAQCTIALCELYAITKDSMLEEPAQRAVQYCIDSQAPEGGWRYFPKEDSDTSVTGWVVMALQSARMGGLNAPSASLARVSKFLDSVATHGGSRYAYQKGRIETPAMTAEALLCRQYLGWKHDDHRLLKGVKYLSNHPVDWNDRDVYYWYYATQVMHHMGGDHWVKWNKVMRQVVPENQVRSGKERGSWDPGDSLSERSAGRLFTTCLSTYMLEVYYRHLPLYSLERKIETAADEAPSSSPAAEAPSVDASPVLVTPFSS